MKKSIKALVLTTLMVMAGGLSAQTLINGGFDAMMLNIDGKNSQVLPGFHAGITTNVALSRHIGVAPGIYYSRHSGDLFENQKYTESTVNIPVVPNVRLYFSELSYVYIFAGPEFNIGITAKSSIPGESESFNYYDDKSVSAAQEMRRYNISVMFGAGIKLDFIDITLGATGNIFNQHYIDNIDQKAYRVFLGAGFVF